MISNTIKNNAHLENDCTSDYPSEICVHQTMTQILAQWYSQGQAILGDEMMVASLTI